MVDIRNVRMGLNVRVNFRGVTGSTENIRGVQPVQGVGIPGLVREVGVGRGNDLNPRDHLSVGIPYDFDAYTLLANAKSNSNDAAGALKSIQDRGALSFSLESVQMRERGENGYVVEGMVMGRGEENGKTVAILIEFVDSQGQVAATEQLQLVIPAAGESELFQAELTSDTPLAGFRFQKVSTG